MIHERVIARTKNLWFLKWRWSGCKIYYEIWYKWGLSNVSDCNPMDQAPYVGSPMARWSWRWMGPSWTKTEPGASTLCDEVGAIIISPRCTSTGMRPGPVLMGGQEGRPPRAPNILGPPPTWPAYIRTLVIWALLGKAKKNANWASWNRASTCFGSLTVHYTRTIDSLYGLAALVSISTNRDL